VLTDGCWIHPLAYGNGSTACLPTGGLPASTPSPTYDVALLRLSQPVSRTSAKPTPVLLATPGGVSAWPGQEVTVVGYGETPSVLRTRVRGNATLSDFNGSFQWFLPPSGSSEARAAPGDSGGPLLWPVSSSRPSIVAVHHGVVGMTQWHWSPTISPNVGRWINNVMSGLSDTAYATGSTTGPSTGWLGEGTDGDTEVNGTFIPGDNCPNLFNPWQDDEEGDGIGNECDRCSPGGPSRASLRDDDPDHDRLSTQCLDNCPTVYNPSQTDADGDGRGDACDLCPGTGVSAGDVRTPRFRTSNQTNANLRVEQELGVRVAADLCDAYPTNPIDEVNNLYDRLNACAFGPGFGECRRGSSKVYLGMAPRIATEDPVRTLPYARPSAVTAGAALVSPTWRCVCMTSSGALLGLSDCYDASGPCRAAYAPPTGAPGTGWHLLQLQRTVTTPTLSSGQVYGEPTGSTARILSFNTRTSRSNAAASWRSAIGESTWYWDWSADGNLPTNLPRTADFGTEVVSARVVFWTRSQYPDDPPPRSATTPNPVNDAQRSMRMTDTYSSQGVALVNEHDAAIPTPLIPAPGPHQPQPAMPGRPPIGGMGPLPAEQLVDRSLTILYPLTGQTGPSTHFFTTGTTSDAVRGLEVARLDVRQGVLMESARTDGASGNLPIYIDAAYAVATPDAQGWSDVAAFGGRDAVGTRTASLFYTSHSYDASGHVVYTWHKAAFNGSPPSAREGASLAYNAIGKRLYVFGGRDGSGAYGDLRHYDLIVGKWYQATLSTTISARYDVGVAVSNDTLFLAGGAAWGGSALGDLHEIDGLTGEVRAYGNVLPQGARPWFSFDDHGDGFVYGGGYIGSTWYRDVWLVDVHQDGTVNTSFVYNFAIDGMAGTADYAVVADIYHGMYWGVPGHNPGGATQSLRYLRDATSYVVDPSGNGSAPLAARVATGSSRPSAPTSPPRQLRRTDSSVRSTRIEARGARTTTSTAAPQ
jgi:hypothetical protein